MSEVDLSFSNACEQALLLPRFGFAYAMAMVAGIPFGFLLSIFAHTYAVVPLGPIAFIAAGIYYFHKDRTLEDAMSKTLLDHSSEAWEKDMVMGAFSKNGYLLRSDVKNFLKQTRLRAHQELERDMASQRISR